MSLLKVAKNISDNFVNGVPNNIPYSKQHMVMLLLHDGHNVTSILAATVSVIRYILYPQGGASCLSKIDQK